MCLAACDTGMLYLLRCFTYFWQLLYLLLRRISLTACDIGMLLRLYYGSITALLRLYCGILLDLSYLRRMCLAACDTCMLYLLYFVAVALLAS